ncbi:hypothetical protein COO60DRAFT_1493697 [Scenedesmus sp. NREL 46B-D3]|nr:hypothetical protein COO60DRAFT_1493697 [Scenedesmus sp. NREL 46B-D3]
MTPYFSPTGSCRLHISEGNLPVVVLSTCMYFVRALFWHRGPCGRCVTERWLGILGGSIRLLRPWRVPWWPAAPPAAAGGRWRAWKSQAVVFTAGFAIVFRGVAFLEAAGDHIANKKCCILMAFFVVALLSDQPVQRWLRWCGSDKTHQLDDVFGPLHVLASKKLGQNAIASGNKLLLLSSRVVAGLAGAVGCVLVLVCAGTAFR